MQLSIESSQNHITHYKCVELAAAWLATYVSVVITEQKAFLNDEIPDVIGFSHGNYSILIECKVSRSDYFADRMKPFRNKGGMGKYRFYCCPESMIKLDELPKRWGLLYVLPDGRVAVRKNVLPKYRWRAYENGNEFERDLVAEQNSLISHILK